MSRIWDALKRACTPHPEDFALTSAETIDPTAASILEAVRTTQENDDMNDSELERINVQRRKKGLQPLTQSQARRATLDYRTDSGHTLTDYLILYALMSGDSETHRSTASSPSFEDAPKPAPIGGGDLSSGFTQVDTPQSFDAGSSGGGSPDGT